LVIGNAFNLCYNKIWSTKVRVQHFLVIVIVYVSNLLKENSNLFRKIFDGLCFLSCVESKKNRGKVIGMHSNIMFRELLRNCLLFCDVKIIFENWLKIWKFIRKQELELLEKKTLINSEFWIGWQMKIHLTFPSGKTLFPPNFLPPSLLHHFRGSLMISTFIYETAQN
jgi:hypothetical protein